VPPDPRRRRDRRDPFAERWAREPLGRLRHASAARRGTTPWREHRATREAVALLDQSPPGKLLIQGRDAEAFLPRVCAANLSNVAFPRYSHREIDIGDTVARAARLSYAGELG